MAGLFWGILCLVLCAPKLRTAPRLIGLVALAYALNESATLLPVWWPALWFGLQHNWLGKAVSVAVSLLVVYGFQWVSPAEVGLARPAPGSLRMVGPVVLVFAGLQLWDEFAHRHLHTPPGLETYLYQLTMPGIAEELFFRGTLLGLLSRVFPRTIPFFGTRTSWGGVAGLILFILGHGLSFPASPLALLPRAHFSVGLVLDTLLFGTQFLWVRERTGSCWAAIATHNLMNTCLTLGHSLL